MFSPERNCRNITRVIVPFRAGCWSVCRWKEIPTTSFSTTRFWRKSLPWAARSERSPARLDTCPKLRRSIFAGACATVWVAWQRQRVSALRGGALSGRLCERRTRAGAVLGRQRDQTLVSANHVVAWNPHPHAAPPGPVTRFPDVIHTSIPVTGTAIVGAIINCHRYARGVIRAVVRTVSWIGCVIAFATCRAHHSQ